MMHLKRSKICLAFWCLGINGAFAGSMGPLCTPGQVSVPCPASGWELQAEALYLQSLYSHSLSYLGTLVDPLGTPIGFSNNNPDWGWGFKLEGRYYFNTGNDLDINWYHLSKNTTHQNAFNIVGFVVRSMDTDRIAITPSWDAVNIEFAQHVNFAQAKQIRFHGGVQYARIKTETVTTRVIPETGDYNHESRKSSSFGPRVGANLSYGLAHGVAVYANAASALLVGTSRFNGVQGNIFGPGTLAFSAKKTSIIPELEAKLGLSYDYPTSHGNLGLNAGYMWVNYFHAQPNHLRQGPGAPVNRMSSVNFGVHGPYAGLKWVSTSI